MKKVKVDKSIPVPAKRGIIARLPLGTMKVGESCVAELPAGRTLTAWQRYVLGAIGRKDFGKKRFTTKQVEKGVRIWRVK